MYNYTRANTTVLERYERNKTPYLKLSEEVGTKSKGGLDGLKDVSPPSLLCPLALSLWYLGLEEG